MKKNVLQNYERLAAGLGLKLDPLSGLLYGQSGGYSLLVYAQNERAPYALTAAVSASRGNLPVTKEEGRDFARLHKRIHTMTQEGSLIKMTLTDRGAGDSLTNALRECLGLFLEFLHTNGFQSCCMSCGSTEAPVSACVAGSSYLQLCESCFVGLQQKQTIQNDEKKRRKENIVGGIVGALIGSLLGVACIVILGQLGYVAAISGVVMAVCTLKGYELLGGKLSTVGVICSIVVMLAMIYVGNQLDWAIAIAAEFEVGIGDAFRAVPLVIQEYADASRSYYANLVLVYLFALAGAVPTIHSALTNQKRSDALYRLQM